MNKRIRYVNSPDGGLNSKNVLKSVSGAEYLAYVGADGRSGRVMLATGESVVEVNATSPHKVKIKLKDALVELGVNFEIEKRVKRETE